MPRKNRRRKADYHKKSYFSKKDWRALRSVEKERTGHGSVGSDDLYISKRMVDPRTMKRLRAAGDGKDIQDNRYSQPGKAIFPHRGELWYVDLGEFDNSSVQRGMRPALILSPESSNRRGGTVTVLPLTSQLKRAWHRSNVLITADDVVDKGTDTDLDEEQQAQAQPKKTCKPLVPSLVLADQIRVLDKRDVMTRIGKVDAEKLSEIERTARAWLGL